MDVQSQAPTPSRPLSPWLTIWFSPRATIRRIVDTDPERHVLLLAMLTGFGSALDRASSRSLGDSMSLPVVLLFCAVVGGLIGGPIGLYLSGALLRWAGSRLGGQASSVEVRAAIAWSSVPWIWALVLWIPQSIIFGNQLFTREMPILDANPALALIFIPVALVGIVVAIWQFVILLKCLGEVHQFSAWRALGSVLLGSAVVVVPILCLVLIAVALRLRQGN